MGAEHKKLGVPGEQELSGRGVSYCATCDAAFFNGAETVIVGGGDSAMEEAIFLSKFASKVTIVHRRAEFRASKIMLERARAQENIELLTPYTVNEFVRRRERCARPRHADSTSRPARSATCPSRAPSSRSATSRSRASSATRSTLDDEGYVMTDGRSTRTNRPGVFAAGDLVDHTYRQAITAAGSGCQAALDAEWYLRDTPEVPTPAGMPGAIWPRRSGRAGGATAARASRERAHPRARAATACGQVRRRSRRARLRAQDAVAGDHDRDRIGAERVASCARAAGAAGLGRDLGIAEVAAVGDRGGHLKHAPPEWRRSATSRGGCRTRAGARRSTPRARA